ncbi:MAG: S-layer homology domain-containing protein [Patescibacteria group bacterium]
MLQNLLKKTAYGSLMVGLTLMSLVAFTKSTYAVTAEAQDPVTLSSNLKIVDFEVENAIFDPWDDQELRIDFTINEDADVTFEIYDEDDDLIKTVKDEKFYEKGDYTITWDGEDEEGDIASQGEYSYKLKVENGNDSDKETGAFYIKKGYNSDKISTQDPRLKNVFVTKDEFDPGRNEETTIVFDLTAKADLQVTIYDEEDKKVVELMDEDDQSADNYQVTWDGEEALDTSETYTYRIYAKNSKGEEIKEGKIKVAEDNPKDTTANIYKDQSDEIIYTPKNNELGISFKLEKSAEVTLEIRDKSNLIAEITEKEEFSEGSHTLYWDGEDKYNDVTEDGIYKYRLTAKNKKGKNVEEGYFLISGATEKKFNNDLCGKFNDLTEDSKYCEAIEWAVGEGVFNGYNDGTFRANQAISRAESLKVILNALNVNTIKSYNYNLGFYDTEKGAWYEEFIQTGLSLGIVKGYSDNTFRPFQSVNRIEALTMLLNTAKAKDNITIPTNNIGQPYYDTPNTPATKWYLSYVYYAQAYDLTDNEKYFYPDAKMTRGEMADMLYRYQQSK